MNIGDLGTLGNESQTMYQCDIYMEPADEHFESNIKLLYNFLEKSQIRVTISLADCSQQTLGIAKYRAYYLTKIADRHTLLVNPLTAHDKLIEVKLPVEWNDRERRIKHAFYVEIRIDDRIIYSSYELSSFISLNQTQVDLLKEGTWQGEECEGPELECGQSDFEML